MICLSTVQRIAKNTGIVIAGDVTFRLISLVVIIYLARYLGTADFGKYSFVFAYLAFFSIITDLGLQTILVREMARDPSITPRLIGNASIIRWILTAIAVASSLVVITLMSYPADTTRYIYIASLTVLFVSFSDFYRTIFEANLRMEYNIVAKLVFKFLSAGLILWIVLVRGTLMQVMIALVFSEMVKTLINYSFSRKFVRPRFEIDFRLWKYLFKESLPIAFSSIILLIYHSIDVVMLSIMVGDISVGLYSAAYKLSEPLFLIPFALVLSLFPIMSASFKTSKEKVIKSYRLATKYLLIITLPIAMGTTLLADKIILLIYGTEFSGSAVALQILIWTLVFSSVGFVLLRLLVSMDKQKLNALCHTSCAIVNIALNLMLIPMLSYNGAAIATLITSMVLYISSFYFVSKHLQALPILKIVIKPMIASLMMGTFVYYFIELNICLLVLLAAGIYSLVLIALKTFSKEDVDIVIRMLGRSG